MDDVTITTEIERERTVVSVSGTRSAAVVLEDESGERVYLPPGDSTASGSSPYDALEDRAGSTDSPYDGHQSNDGRADAPAGGDPPVDGGSPYEGITAETPYESARRRTDRLGVTPTETGFRVVHPAPATDVRTIRL